MKFLGGLRIFKRLRDIASDLLSLLQLVLDNDTSLRPMLHALHRRLLALESRVVCARCGGLFDNMKRESGPMLMQRGEGVDRTYMIACYDCEPYTKRNGWIRSKPILSREEASA